MINRVCVHVMYWYVNYFLSSISGDAIKLSIAFVVRLKWDHICKLTLKNFHTEEVHV